MGWIRFLDGTGTRQTFPKDAVLIPPGMEPPKNYKFAYLTEIEGGQYVDDDHPFGVETMYLEREVWVPITGDET